MINVVVQVKDGMIIAGPWYFPQNDEKLHDFTDKLGGVVDPFDEDSKNGALILSFGEIKHFQEFKQKLKKPVEMKTAIKLWDEILS